MAARYIKVNPKVAQYLRLENDRNTVKDGNYLLWQADMLAFGKLIDLPATLEQIGGIALQAHEAREEQDGTVSRPLPTATDPRFVIEVVDEPVTGGDTETTGDEVVEPDTTEEVAADPEINEDKEVQA